LTVQISNKRLSEFIQKYSTKFARYVNKVYNRKGHVFQGRHKSKLISGDRHLLTSIAYIYNNPVVAGIVSVPEEYKWSNLQEIIHKNENHSYDLIYKMFSDDRDIGRKLFVKWLKEQKCDDISKNFLKLNKGQFLMDELERKKVLMVINRRKEKKNVKLEQRKEKIKDKKMTIEEIKESLKNYLPKKKVWVGVWRTREKFLLHLKWYLLRYYGKLTLEKIRVIEKKSRHTTISDALSTIEKSKKKKQIIDKEIEGNTYIKGEKS
jgi:hypothetical protein